MPSRSRAFRLRALLLGLALPLIAVPALVHVLAPGDGGSRLALARGSSGGTFHPVAGTFEPDSTKLSSCRGDWACLEQAFGNLAYGEGPRRALAVFEARLLTDPVVLDDCHRIVHAIGSAALERFDGNVARTFAQGSPACVSGYYHGILERAFLGVSTRARLREVAASLCAGAGLRRRGFLDYQCRHGLGHGLMIQTGYALPVALSVCAGLGTGWDRKACASGAFMENVDTRFGFRSPWLDDDDPLYPCERVEAPDRRSCYLRATWRILTLTGFDWGKAAALCSRLGAWSRTCFQGYGRDAAEEARYAPARILELCRVAGKREGECLFGAARTIANASGLPGVAPAAALCRRVRMSLRGACVSGIGLVLGMLYPSPSARLAACTELTQRHARACARAANAEVDPSGRRAWG